MSARVLVVGGAGYIGSHVAHELVDVGHDVTVFDDLSRGERANVPAAARFVQGDVRRPRDLDDVLSAGFDVAFHFAALKAAGESMERPHEYAVHNISGSLDLLRALHGAGVNRLVFSSSAAVYGAPVHLPIDETHPTNPQNYYGFTKLAIEQNLRWFDRLAGLRFASLRYFNATGYDLAGRVSEREKGATNLCPVLMEVASGRRDVLKVFGSDYATRDGTCIRDYIHVNDLAAAHIAAMDCLLAGDPSLVVNLGNETGTTVLEMVRAASRVLGFEVRHEIVDRRAGDCAELVASGALARRVLGFVPRHGDLDTIVRSMCRVYGIEPAAD